MKTPWLSLWVVLALTAVASAQAPATPPPANTARPAIPGPVVDVGNDYVIGPEDVIGILFWREPDMTGDVTVRPDGKIAVPLLGELNAAGLRPDALGVTLKSAAGKFLSDANVTVVVRQVNSRKAFITGEVRTPGAYSLAGPRTVLQVIAMAGGLNEYAKRDKITIVRTQGGQTRTFKFNYKEFSEGRKLEQNILLVPGDTVIVP
jgi:polysaccharide export outer membrane protein